MAGLYELSRLLLLLLLLTTTCKVGFSTVSLQVVVVADVVVVDIDDVVVVDDYNMQGGLLNSLRAGCCCYRCVVVDIDDVVDVDDDNLQGGLLSSLLGSHQAGKPSALVQLSVLHVI